MKTIARWAAAMIAGLLVLGMGAAFAQGRISPTGGTCGGIANLQCGQGDVCVMTGPNFPDRAGVCRRAGGYGGGGDGGHVMCPMIYQPVCGTDGQTYSNRCVAESRGATVAYGGQCQARPPTACPYIYQPVCGRDGQTYPNRCVANAQGARVRHAGACRMPRGYAPTLPPTPIPYGSYQPAPYGPPPPPPRPYGERG